MYTHTHLLYLSVDGYLACFHILNTVNNAAVIIGVHVSVELMFLFPLDKYPEVGLLDCTVVLFLVFCGTSILFSIAAVPISCSVFKTFL